MTNVQRKLARSPNQPTGQWIATEKRLAIYLRDEFRCLYCGRPMNDAKPADITLDHLKTKSNGGHNHESNLITACRSCNSARGDRSWTRFVAERLLGNRELIAQVTYRINQQRRFSLRKYLSLAKSLIAERK